MSFSFRTTKCTEQYIFYFREMSSTWMIVGFSSLGLVNTNPASCHVLDLDNKGSKAYFQLFGFTSVIRLIMSPTNHSPSMCYCFGRKGETEWIEGRHFEIL